MTAVQIRLAQSGMVLHRHLRRLYQQTAQHAVALLGDRAQLLSCARTVFARNQSQITGHLFASLEAADLADGQHESQPVFGPTPACVISNLACGFSSAACCTAASSM